MVHFLTTRTWQLLAVALMAWGLTILLQIAATLGAACLGAPLGSGAQIAKPLLAVAWGALCFQLYRGLLAR